MPYKDPARKAQWRRDNAKRCAEHVRRWAEKIGPEEVRRRALEYKRIGSARARSKRIAQGWKDKRLRALPREVISERKRVRDRERYQEQRDMILGLLGGACAWCGIDDPVVLEVDHVAGDGNVYRKEPLQGWRHRDDRH